MRRILSAVLTLCLVFSTFSAFAEESGAAAYPEREYEFSGTFEKKKTNPAHVLDETVFAQKTAQHPYLYIGEDDIAPLRAAVNGKYSDRFLSFMEYVDEAVAQGPTEWHISENTEENWIRDVSDNLCNIAFAYLMTEDETYLNSAAAYIEAICGYAHWGRPGSAYENNDLAASHALRALALSYDWLYGVLPETTKTTLLETAKQRGEIINAGGWWRGSYMQNHLWYTRYAAALIGAAIINDYPEARVWINKSIADFNKAASFLGDDGGAHEGMQYWRYGGEAYFLFHLFAKETLGVDYTTDGYDQNAWLSPMYFWVGANDWSNAKFVLDFGDSSRFMDVSTNAALLAYFAETYGNGNAKWLSDRMYDYSAQNGMRIEDWWSFIMLADDVDPVSPSETLPTGYLFEDLGYVLSRSDWSGNESVLGFRCGMNTGIESLGYNGNAGSSHVHPDIGAPVLFGYGEYLLRDDGYGTTSRTNHSELFINGSGQPWDKTKEYLLSSYPYIEKYADTEEYTYAACNGTDAYGGLETYKQEFELEKWVRHFLFLKKKDCLLVVDEVKTKTDKDLEFRWFTESVNLAMQGERSSIATSSGTNLKITSIGDDADVVMENKSVPYRDGTRNAVCVSKTGSEWNTATAITWSPKAKSPQNVTGSQDGDVWSFDLGSELISLNTSSHEIDIVDFSSGDQTRIGERAMYDIEQLFKNNGSINFDASQTANVEIALDGNDLAIVGTDKTGGKTRIYTNELSSGAMTGKVVLQFDYKTNRGATSLTAKYGQSWKNLSTTVLNNVSGASDRGISFKIILDFDNEKVYTYANGEKTEADMAEGTNNKSSRLWLNIGGIGSSQLVGSASINNFTMYRTSGVVTEGAMTERISVGEKTMLGNAAIFTSDGSTLTTSNVTNAEASIEGTALVARQQTPGGSNGAIRIKSESGLAGRADKVAVEFDYSACRSAANLKMKWGQSWSDSSSVTVCNLKAQTNQAVTKVKAILDFKNKTATAYYDGVAQEPVSIPDAANTGNVAMYIHLDTIKANGDLNYVKIDNLTMYEASGAFAAAAANGGAAFNLPIDETLSSAMIDGQSAALMRMTESETVINTYYADCSELAAGVHEVRISAVPIGGTSSDAKTVKYTVTVQEQTEL